MSHGRSALYLQIPPHYCRSFGGLRWAQYGEAIEFLDGPAAGRTFAFAAEVAAFLEGLASSNGSLPRFWACAASPLPDRSGRSRGPTWRGDCGLRRTDRGSVSCDGVPVAQCRGLVFVAEPRSSARGRPAGADRCPRDPDRRKLGPSDGAFPPAPGRDGSMRRSPGWMRRIWGRLSAGRPIHCQRARSGTGCGTVAATVGTRHRGPDAAAAAGAGGDAGRA